MKVREIRYAAAAERDLERLSDWLADVASADLSIRYIRRIKERIDALGVASERGTVRDEITGLRVIGVLRSVSVAFWVDTDTVNIQRILYRGQQWEDAGEDDLGD